MRIAPLLLLACLVIAHVGCAASNTPSADADVVTATLAGTKWQVTGIDGEATMERHRPTIAFGDDGDISGMASCNHYRGSYAVDGRRITIGDLESTLMACLPEAIVAQERRFLDLLSSAEHLRHTAEGRLVLVTAAGARLVAEARD